MMGMEDGIAKKIVQTVGTQLGDKFQSEFDKIGEELKKMVEYMNGLDARIEKLEKAKK